MNQRQIRRYLKSLPTFEARLAARRQLGQDVQTIAEYVCNMVEQGKTCQYVQPLDEATLPTILSAEEFASYQRLTASRWAHRQRKQIVANAIERARLEADPPSDTHKQRRQEEAAIRTSLMAKGAITVSEVARRLGVSVQDVRKLHAAGALPSAGFVPVQHSYGKPVHLWLPETIIRYLNRHHTA